MWMLRKRLCESKLSKDRIVELKLQRVGSKGQFLPDMTCARVRFCDSPCWRVIVTLRSPFGVQKMSQLEFVTMVSPALGDTGTTASARRQRENALAIGANVAMNSKVSRKYMLGL